MKRSINELNIQEKMKQRIENSTQMELTNDILRKIYECLDMITYNINDKSLVKAQRERLNHLLDEYSKLKISYR